jgi:carbonic anhydrase
MAVSLNQSARSRPPADRIASALAGVSAASPILVMGHAGCGAVKATIQCAEGPGQISAHNPHMQPVVDQAGNNLDAATKANAKIQAALLAESSTAIKRLLKEGNLNVAPA